MILFGNTAQCWLSRVLTKTSSRYHDPAITRGDQQAHTTACTLYISAAAKRVDTPGASAASNSAKGQCNTHEPEQACPQARHGRTINWRCHGANQRMSVPQYAGQVLEDVLRYQLSMTLLHTDGNLQILWVAVRGLHPMIQS